MKAEKLRSLSFSLLSWSEIDNEQLPSGVDGVIGETDFRDPIWNFDWSSATVLPCGVSGAGIEGQGQIGNI